MRPLPCRHRLQQRNTVLALSAFLTLLSPAFLLGQTQDWPTYRHDIARSGVTAAKVEMPLTEQWIFRPRQGPEVAWGLPKPQPVEGILELPRVHFDDAFHVAVAGNSLYFGSSSENKVFALDAATGKIRWTKRVEGPVRLAPTVYKGRVFFGADDGYVYCLNALDGKEVWKFRAAPHDEKVLGHGKMISLWPVRTGVLVDEDIAYFGAGVFPMEGVYIYAVRTDDAKVVWKNDTCGEAVQSAVSPQGYLLASKTNLFAPMGRVSPATFDRKTGLFRYTTYFGKPVGGTYALLVDNYVYTGLGEMMGYDQTSRARFAWYPGRQLIVTKDLAYMLNDTEMSALERIRYPKISLQRDTLTRKILQVSDPLYVANRKRNKMKADIKQCEEMLQSLDSLIRNAQERDDQVKLAELKAQETSIRDAQKRTMATLDAAEKEAAKLKTQLDAMKEELKGIDADLASCVKWRCRCDCPDSLILSGNVLLAGGENRVVAVDAVGGGILWDGKVEGKAKGLAVASGRLYVSTDTGAIHCFGHGAPVTAKAVAEPAVDAPYPQDDLTRICAAAAESIVRQTKIKRGYCLALGSGTGRLACELAKRTDLTICGIEPDAEKAEAACEALDHAGLFGHRVVVERCPTTQVPYSDYFADLIVSEDALLSGKLPEGAAEAFRMLKPMGGVICIGQPSEATGKVEPLREADLRAWLMGTGAANPDVTTEGGLWLKYMRGALEGAGSWTHQYATPANTTCSDDQLVRCPLGVLWFGRPGPARIPSRHVRAAASVAMDGRLFVQGENVVMAYDSYNGIRLWERDIPGAMRVGVSNDCSNLALSKDGLFVAVKDKCLRLGVALGETLRTYDMPPVPGGTPGVWGLVAVVDKTLYGTRAEKGGACSCIFAVDMETGRIRWTFPVKSVAHPSISIGGGKVFLVDRDISPAEREEALRKRIEQVNALPDIQRIAAQQQLKSAEVRMVIALDAATGKPVWKRPMDLTGAAAGLYFSAVGTIYQNDTLVVFGVYTDGHYWKDFFAGEFESRRMLALSAGNGKTLWDKRIGYRVRPLVVGNTVHAEPWAFDLRTGEQRTRTNPITGREEPWQFARPGHHCGCPAASPHALYFRSGSLGYYDLDNDYGTMHFGAQRTGCWINFLPANGLLLFPEGSAGCMCPFPNQCTVVFKHRETNRAWAQYSAVGGTTPVKHLALNLGAPGDRKDKDGTLWLAFPRTTGSLVLPFKADFKGLPGGTGFYKVNADTIQVQGTDSPWIYASGFQGLSRAVIPLLMPEDGDALYTVRLAFADMDNSKAGERVFDIKLQDKVVCKAFDIVKEAGGNNRAIVKEFRGIPAKDNLKVDFISKIKKPTPRQLPLVNGIAAIREKVLGLGCVLPSFLVSNAEPEQSGEIRLANNTDSPFAGRLEVKAPEGFTATPAESEVRLATGERATIAVKVALAGKPARGKYQAAVRLLRENGEVESERQMEIEHLANCRRIVVKVSEDAHASQNMGDVNAGAAPMLNVDGGDMVVGDEHHSLAYLKFLLDVPGKPVSAVLRLYNGDNPSVDSGRVCLVTDPWSEKRLTYANRPKPGKELAKIGPVVENQVVSIPLNLDLTGVRDLSLVIDPTGCDGIGYISREGGKPPELIIEYER